ncbi:MAG: recombinase family protein [Clostridia bacterium]|nr:recombinase family protein [Clostridia bacterium]
MKRAALYIRVSTDRQSEEGYSIEFQEEKLRAYCKATDMVVSKDHVFIDPAYSGSNLNRPGLQMLISQVGNFDTVVVYKLDRLSRSQKDTLHLIEDIFIPNNVSFISISESFDTGTPFGRAMVGILSVFSQLERENIKERMLSGRVQRAKEGFHNGQHNTPIGYRYVDGTLVKDEYEAKQIIELCNLYLKGYGTGRIQQEMRNRGYKTNYGYWTRASINTIPFNPVYRGKVTFAGEEYQGEHERIISDDLYLQLLEQKMLRAKGSAFKRNYLLSGLLWCGHCQGRVAAKNIHNRKYYACYSATKSSKHMIKDPNCSLPRFTMDKLESDIFQHIMDIYRNTDRYIEEHRLEHESGDISLYKKRIEALDKQTKRLMDLYQFEEIEAGEIRKRIDAIQSEKSVIQQSIASITHYDYEGFKDSIQALGDEWGDLSIEEKREYLMGVIDKITLYNSGNIKIEIKVNVAI